MSKRNNFELYKKIVEEGFITNEDLYYLGYRINEIKELLENKTLKTNEIGCYEIANINELYYYFSKLIRISENKLAKDFYEKIMEIDKTFEPNIEQLVKIALSYGDAYDAFEYLKNSNITCGNTYSLYQYLFSTIIKLPKEDSDEVKKIYVEGLETENEVDNHIIDCIYCHKFDGALYLINNKSDKTSLDLEVIKPLCEMAETQLLANNDKISEYISNNRLDLCKRYLNKIFKNRNGNTLEYYVYTLILNYENICKGNIPVSTKSNCESLYEAIINHNYIEAEILCKDFEQDNNIHNNVISELLRKINDHIDFYVSLDEEEIQRIKK